MRPGAARCASVLFAAVTLMGGRAAAQTTCESPIGISPAKRWSPPLDRLITINTAQLTLREALDRLAAAGNVRLSYSSQLLTLGANVCIGFNSTPLGDALAAVLRGAAVEPISGGSDQIVLAPIRQRVAAPESLSTIEPVFALPTVVATARPAAPAQSPAPTAVSVVEGDELTARSSGSVIQALNGTVPGLWVWNASPVSLLTHYGSMRGASSFGLNSPKIYIDGIEVANPLLLSRITPDAIERIEVIRGPQGAALYGADAISGVTNIVTRHDGVGVGEPRFRVRSNFGMSGTDYASSAAFGQDHSLGFRTGTQTRSAGFNLQFGTAGEYIPGAFARNASADGSLQLVGARTMLSGTARFSTQKSGSPLSPLVTDAVTQLSEFAPTRLSLQQYTAGIRASYQHSDRWLHSIVAGVDGYALDGVPDASSFILSPVDSALREASGTAIRTTLRLRSTAQLVNTRVTTAALALAVEHSALKEDGEAAVFGGDPVWSGANHQMGPGSGRRPSLIIYESTPHVEESRVNTGLSAQLNTSFANKLHLTAGMRLDRQTSSTLPAGNALLPTAGASYVIEGPVSLKLRAAYGKGIRWPQLVGRPDGFQSAHVRPVRIALEPEQQDGIEAGFDLAVGRSWSLQVTRFDQTASGLIQRVATATTDTGQYGFPRPKPAAYQMQNLGKVGNDGWELQASWQRGAFGLAGTLSLVDSRVERVATGYSGDLQAGDRMLAVPAQTMGIMASWTARRWATSVTAARAADWINYDRIALAKAYADAESGQPLVGAQLRSFWREYDGFTRLRAVVSREVRQGIQLTVTGDNLLNHQIGEPDNITITPGRTISIGLRTAF